MSRYPNRANHALLVIDMQRDVVVAAFARDATIAAVAGLVDRCRRAGVQVVWVRHNDPELTIGSPGWQLVDELVPLPGEPLIDKNYRNSFAGTDLADLLAELDVAHLIVCGAQSEFCITSTVLAGIDRGYDITLVEDAHTTVSYETTGLPVDAEHTIAFVNAVVGSTRGPDAAVDVLRASDVGFINPDGLDDDELLALADAEDADKDALAEAQADAQLETQAQARTQTPADA